MNSQPYYVIMAGGSGKRFWPRGRGHLPKQFLEVLGSSSLFEQTLNRLPDETQADHILVLTGESHRTLAMAQSRLPVTSIIFEPTGRDTAACLALSAAMLARQDPDAVMVVLAADHVIEDKSRFIECVNRAASVAESGALVTIGIPPTRAATGYGYVELGAESTEGVFEVSSFTEKPDEATAKRYLEGGAHLWNSGIFAWRVDALLDEVARQMPELHQSVIEIADAGPIGTSEFEAALKATYKGLQKTSIDYGVLEGAAHVQCVRASFDWDDMGSFAAVARHCDLDQNGNAIQGDAVLLDTSATLVDNRAQGLVATIGVTDLIIVRTADAVLVARSEDAERVKEIVDKLESDGRSELL